MPRVAKISDCTKCISLNNEIFLARPTLIDLNSNELPCHGMEMEVENGNELNGSCNTFNDPSCRIWVPNKIEF